MHANADAHTFLKPHTVPTNKGFFLLRLSSVLETFDLSQLSYPVKGPENFLVYIAVIISIA